MTWPDDYINKVIRGDCLEVMKGIPDGAVDLVVTDPPYGMDMNPDNSRFSGGNNISRAKRGHGVNKRERVIGDDRPFDPTPLLRFPKSVIFGFNHFPEKLPAGACLVWIKRNDDAFGSFLSDAEVAWCSHGRGTFCYRDLSNNGITDERAHPTQKPIPLMRWVISKYSHPDDIILDPFAGSGTTFVAAKQLGRKFIGIEINPDYCKIAEDRLRQEELFG